VNCKAPHIVTVRLADIADGKVVRHRDERHEVLLLER
jgi:hypothetical protein